LGCAKDGVVTKRLPVQELYFKNYLLLEEQREEYYKSKSHPVGWPLAYREGFKAKNQRASIALV
jgi:hypothetical protein